MRLEGEKGEGVLARSGNEVDAVSCESTLAGNPHPPTARRFATSGGPLPLPQAGEGYILFVILNPEKNKSYFTK